MLGPSLFALRRQLLAIVVVGLVAVLAALVGPATAAPKANRFDQINAVSDLPGVAPILDPLLVNPWGLALSPTSPVWVANNVTRRRDALPRRRWRHAVRQRWRWRSP